MRKAILEWGVVAAILGLISLPGIGRAVAGVLLGLFLLGLFAGSRPFRSMYEDR
jgi:hypothetical protein